ncbi:MAG: hypothetical protein IJ048_12470 [Clostridia bacterium]|nr:hypothetical protein [Clostridia bacterium]
MNSNNALMEVPRSTKTIPWIVIGASTVVTGALFLIASLKSSGHDYLWFPVILMIAGSLMTISAFICYRKMRFQERILIMCMIGKGIDHGDERWQ